MGEVQVPQGAAGKDPRGKWQGHEHQRRRLMHCRLDREHMCCEVRDRGSKEGGCTTELLLMPTGLE